MINTVTNKKFAGMQLARDINRGNMAAFYWACLTGILLSTFVPQLQPFILTEYLAIPQDKQGVASGNLSFWGEVAIILTVGIWGALSDRFGRRPVMVAGYLIMAVGVFLYPRADSYEDLLLGRVVFGIGVAAYSVMIVTLIGDYVVDESRGKATGMLGFFNGIGALITVMFLLKLPAILQNNGMSAREAGDATYGMVVILIVFTSAVLWFGLSKKGHHRQAEDKHNILSSMKEGLRAGRDPAIRLAYAAAFVSRGNLAIVGTFFTLWLSNYASSELGLSRADALAKAGTMIAITQSIALFSAPIFGIMTDKINRVDAVLVTLFLAFIGYGGTIFIDNPFGLGMLFCAVFIGMSEVGCVITSAVLISQQSPEKIRGSVVGVFNLFGALGILVASKIGGIMFDDWKEAGPFVLFGGIALLVLIFALMSRSKFSTIKPHIDAETVSAT